MNNIITAKRKDKGASPSITIGFVLYVPSALFFSRLERLLDAKLDAKILIYDNSPNPVIHPCLTNARVEVIGRKGNNGLGRAMHDLGKYAYSSGVKFWLYFDQDTEFNAETIKFIKKFIGEKEIWPASVASVFFTNKKGLHDEAKKRQQYKEVILPHHSGMLFYLPALEKIGWHNPNVFLDCLDYEYCLRVRTNKMKIIEVRDVVGIDHSTSQDAVIYPIFRYRFNLSRCYSLTRIKDTCKKALTLIFKGVISRQPLFSIYMIRFIVVYVSFQIYAYSMKYLKFNKPR